VTVRLNEQRYEDVVNHVLNLQEQTPPVALRERQPWALIRRHRWLLVGIALGLLLVLLLVVRTVGRNDDQRGAGRNGRFNNNEDVVAVSIATVTSGDIQVRIPALGTVTPLATATVKAQVVGLLQKIDFTEGQLVHQGDLLAQIYSRPFEAAVDQADGTLKRDQALLADARLDLKRYEDLLKQDGIPAQQVDTQRATVAQYVGTVEADQANLQSAKVNLAWTRIVAPVTGRAGLRQVDQGNYVTPNDANGIVVITQLQPITVIFPIPEDYVTQISRRLHEGATLPVIARDKGNTTDLAQGKLLTLDNQIDTTTGTVKLRALFENQDDSLFPNQFVNVQLIEDTLHNQIIMPNAAVRHGAPNGVTAAFVYVVNRKASTVAVRPVTLGVVDPSDSRGEMVAILAGLKPGDVVVTEGGDRLRDGAQVLLPGAAPPKPQPNKKGWNGRSGNRFRR